MTKSVLALTVAMSALIFNAPPAFTEDHVTPYANLTLWSAWTYKTAELGEELYLLDELGNVLRNRIDYQTDVTATASSFIGITGEKNNVSMKAEVGVYPYSAGNKATLVTIRYFYGDYKFGPFELRGGYDMAPYEAINRNDVCDGEVFADASLFDGFQPQLRFSAYGAYFQIMRSVINNSELYLDSGLVAIGELTTIKNTKSVIPKMALGYTYTAPQFSIGVHGIFQSYSIDEIGSPLDGESITAAVGSIAMLGDFGPFSLNISGFVGQNPGEPGIFTNNNKNGNYIPFNAAANSKAKTDSSFNLHNTLGYGFSASAGYNIMGFLQINWGIAFDADKNKVFESPRVPSGVDASYAYFADFMFFIKPNLRLVPTIKVVDYLNTPGNVFEASDGHGNILPQYKIEGVLTRLGLAFQASM